jgi:hypothetical protein
MDIMRHGHDLFRPAGTRTPGGADYPLFTKDMFVSVDLLPSVTGSSTVVGVVDTGLVLDDVTLMPHEWIGNRVLYQEERDRRGVATGINRATSQTPTVTGHSSPASSFWRRRHTSSCAAS